MNIISNIKLNNKSYHSYLYSFLLILLAASLPFSAALISISQILLFINWLVEGNLKKKIVILKNRKSVLLFSLLFFIHIIGLLNTSDFEYATYNLNNQLPFIILPLIIGTIEISKRILKIIITTFIFSIIIKSILYSLTSIFQLSEIITIAQDISHIRLSLLVNLAIFFLGYQIVKAKFSIKYKTIIPKLIACLWLVIFLLILQSITGIIIFITTLILISIYLGFKSDKHIHKIILFSIPLLFILFCILSVSESIKNYYNIDKIEFKNLEKYTKKGNLYTHDLERKQFENGHHVWINICEDELSEEWAKVSKMNFTGLDKKNQTLKYTLISYLTSKGLKKNAEDFKYLTTTDIKNIEEGITNYIYANKFSISNRIYKIIWEIDRYKNGYNPSGHSVAQRFEYFKTGFQIFTNNLFIGVGTGDIDKAFKTQYEKQNSQLESNSRLKTHNQFLTYLITFGILGFIIITIALFLPPYFENRYKTYHFRIFLIISLLSFFNEDTLQNQLGITYFSFFYSLFVFSQAESVEEI